jgi:hypothetical protein
MLIGQNSHKLAAIALLALASQMAPATAQIQRSFINLSFEEPPIPGENCFSIRVSFEFTSDPRYAVPGWRTTEGSPNIWDDSGHGTCGGHPPEMPPKAPFKCSRTDSVESPPQMASNGRN